MSIQHSSPASAGQTKASGSPRSEESLALLALLQVEGLGNSRLAQLLTHFGSAAALLNAFAADAQGDVLQGIGPRARRKLAEFLRAPRQSGHWQIARQSLAWLARNDGELLLQGERGFPPLLRQLSDCPPLLFLRGSAQLLLKPAIAIVGTRKPSRLGRSFARRLAAELAQSGFLVCSGLALGIDAEAHRGALEAGAATVAILATGVDTIYPPSHRGLAEQIIASGALLSEMPLGTPAVPGLFPRRNRLVSGLCLGVIVVEAGLPSGSLHTANFAAEQNREVFAVPGALNNAVARGCNQLLREGAQLVESSADVIAVLGGHLPREQGGHEPGPATGEAALPEPMLQEALLPESLQPALQALADGPAAFDELCERVNQDPQGLAAALVELELRERVFCDAGCYSLAT